jgi:histidyl-tRNA synthetase
MKIIEFLKENKVELFDKLVEIDEFYIEETEIDDLMFEVGCYEKGNTLVDSEEICVLLEGFDVSFDEKLVKGDDYYEFRNFEFEFKDKKIYCVLYNV